MSHRHPDLLNKNDIILAHFRCFGKNLALLKKVIKIVNERIKLIRTNKVFWEQVSRKFSKDFGIENDSLIEFDFMKEHFLNKKDLDNGFFDLQ